MITDEDLFFNRDISWLGFNGRVLEEAASEDVPLGERMRFLAIYSANLDEFYRVRMPVLTALKKISKKQDIPELPVPEPGTLKKARAMVQQQQERFGELLKRFIIPQLSDEGVELIYNKPIPAGIIAEAQCFFLDRLAAYLEVSFMGREPVFFPKNNQLYLAVDFQVGDGTGLAFVNIPSEEVSRFFCVKKDGITYVLFIDDIIRHYVAALFPNRKVAGTYAFKVTRDAELDLQDEYEGDIAEKIEKQISKRDFGLATRFLYQPGIPVKTMDTLADYLSLRKANQMQGGFYHNLKDFFRFPVHGTNWGYLPMPPLRHTYKSKSDDLLAELVERDLLVSTPYESYGTILRFFNVAAIDPEVTEVYATMYRIANDSQIAHALMSAAKNGKTVTVFVELKARFDEANNIHWAKLMKEAGVNIIYSIPDLKVHAKVALLKRERAGQHSLFGLLSTGNLNENTAKQYTDHVLLTSHPQMLLELELLFVFLKERRHPVPEDGLFFGHLLVAQFNLQAVFLDLIDQEIRHAKAGLPSGIVIKLNNLEEEVLIRKLYEASSAGVPVNLIVRSICRLRPGVPGLSDHIRVRRVVDRFLEHGRVFIFHNNGAPKYYLGSADWMNRNIYNRIEVCFPLYDKQLQLVVRSIIDLQLADDVSAVALNSDLENVPLKVIDHVRSQLAIYEYLSEGIG